VITFLFICQQSPEVDAGWIKTKTPSLVGLLTPQLLAYVWATGANSCFDNMLNQNKFLHIYRNQILKPLIENNTTNLLQTFIGKDMFSHQNNTIN
jgi:hypothetical protein